MTTLYLPEAHSLVEERAEYSHRQKWGKLLKKQEENKEEIYRGNGMHKLIVILISLIFWAIANSLMGRTYKEVESDSKYG